MSFLEEDLSCPVCFDTFQQPVVLPCSHSFCRDCLANSWRTSSRPECPNCRKAYPLGFTPPANLVLRNIAEAYLKKQQEDQASVSQGEAGPARTGRTASGAAERDARACCSVHGERLLLFCKVDREALCTVCQTSRKHLGHQLCPLDEAIQDLKEEAKASLKPLREKLESFQKVKQDCEKALKHIKTQSSQTELQIKAEFEALRNFLLTEERCRIAALKDETERKGRAMKEKVEDLTAQIALLCNSIALAEREAEAHDLTVQDCNTNSRRALCTRQNPQMASGVLIDMAKHLGSLRFRVWEKMLETVQYSPITLDPNTATPWLAFLPDLTAVWYAGAQPQLPDNPERCDLCVCVLGAGGFVAGRHCWEVEVGDKPKWDLGVLWESVQRKGILQVNPAHGFWAVALRDGGQYSACTQPWTPLALQQKPQRVRVLLDYDKGEVSFFNASDMSHIYTFRDRFHDRIFPFVSPCVSENGRNTQALKICPAKVSILHQ
ncbi:zinc-binding protein A33-like [Paramormyrops kingsleyae]|uniref:zinc-binding protein A33-like n=1 Tax=Paramormyrops kingsleyae TaxID=1676925 RepID=UPI003B974C02